MQTREWGFYFLKQVNKWSGTLIMAIIKEKNQGIYRRYCQIRASEWVAKHLIDVIRILFIALL